MSNAHHLLRTALAVIVALALYELVLRAWLLGKLRESLHRRSRRYAEKHDVRVDEVATAGVRDLLETLKTVPPATENKCLAAALSTIETGLPRLLQRASAWSRGDIAGMQRLPDSDEDLECRAALTSDAGSADLLGRIRREWLEALDSHVRGHSVTLAVVHFDLLVEKDGLLEQLQAQGYTLVDSP